MTDRDPTKRNGDDLGDTNPSTRRMSARASDSVVTLLVVAFAVTSLLFDWGEGASDPNGVAAAVAVVASGAVWFCRRNPIPLLLAIAVARIYVAGTTGNEIVLIPAVAVALFTVARYADRKRGLTVAAVSGFVVAAAVAALDADQFLPEFLGEAAMMAVPIAVGDAARTRADRIRDLIETEATTRVQAERIRIARDLHDVVAHGLSTIAIQSGVAAHLIDRDPDQAKQALEIINATGKRSLEELRSMVGVLRSTDEAPFRPTPTDPNDLTDLLEGAAQAGIDVTTEVIGSFPSTVADSCVVAVHRIIQEALTNVARHAGAAATTVRIAHGEDRVEITVFNAPGPGRGTSHASTGVGIIGMRERAESLGGTLTAESTGDAEGFCVTAVLPYSQGGRATT